MRNFDFLKLSSSYFVVVILFSSILAQTPQRFCRHNRCIQYPNQSQIPVWSPVPTTPLYNFYPQQQQQQPQTRPNQQLEQSPSFEKQPYPVYQNADVDTKDYYDSDTIRNISLSVLNLAQALSRHFQSSSLKGEQIFSPVSIFSVLQLLLSGANGKTYDELNKFLSYNTNMGSIENQEEFGKLLKDLISDETILKRMRPDDYWKLTGKMNNGNSNIDDSTNNRNPKSENEIDHKIRVANGIFIQDGYSLRPAYRDVIENIYNSEVKLLNFKQKDNAEYVINNWVKDRTYGKILNIIDKGGIKQDTDLIMACALYFKAFWERPFISGGTLVNDFYPDGIQNPAIKVNMMANGGVFPYYDDNVYQIKIIGFPYKTGKTTMYVLQPYDSTRERLRQMQETLTPEMIEFLISQMKLKTAVFAFPRLHIANSFNMRSTLSTLGLNSIFSNSQSDFSLISEAQYPKQFVMKPTSDFVFLNRFGDTESNESNTNTTEKTLSESDITTTKIPEESQRIKRRVTYKVESDEKNKQQPLRFKDLVINKRITKLNTVKKNLRQRRDISQTSPNPSLYQLDKLRNSNGLTRPNLFVDDIIHKIDLVVNEEGTEGAAATITYLRRSGTDVVFRAETPFLILIRHDTTKLPLFYGAIFEPTFN